MNIGKTGLMGENLTAGYLRKKGAVIVKRNYSCRFGEIDIIAELGEYIIFTEVKTRNENAIVSGAESVDAKKINRLRLTAEDFLSKYETSLQPRFDVAEVTVFKKENGEDGYKLRYIKNAF